MNGLPQYAVVSLLALLTASCAQEPPPATVITGLVDATEVDIASKVPGRVEELFVQEGQRVKRGDKLVKLRSEEILAKFAQATAASEAAQAKLSLARHGARPAEKAAVARELDAATHQLELAQKTLDRMTELLDSGTIPQAKFDEAKLRYDLAREQLAMVEAKQSIVTQGARSEEIAALAALVEQSRGVIAEMQAYEAEAEQHAPIDGEVSKIVLQPGELAGTGAAIVTLVAVQDPWVTFAVREDLLDRVRPGAEVTAEIPALKREVKLKVFQIAPLGDFATWKATTQKNGFDLKSFEVKARPIAPIDGLRPGMTVRWTVG
ncbi:MAG TPA: efflux RND transporter periplasmic adaptor subunit [Polyangiaceae bacterium]|nr:efflux RND transporter periplasmic adaptor subunit [Polyangiaceae bacterium]